MPSPSRVSVVINTYNRAASLDTALRSLRRLNYPHFEVIVVNGPSTDHTADVLNRYAGAIRVGTCGDRNLSVSRNVGIEMARGDLVAFMDDDAVADENWLNDAVAGFDSDDVGGVTGTVFDYTGFRPQYRYTICDRIGNSFFDGNEPALAFCYPGCLRFPNLQGGNSAIRRSAILDVGGFDEEFDYYLDEVDVCLRLVDAGYLLKQLPNAFVYHRNLPSHLRNADRIVTDWRSIIKNKVYFGLKNAPPGTEFLSLLRDWTQYADGVESALKGWLAENKIESETIEKFYRDSTEAFREGILKGMTQPRRWRDSPAAREMRGAVATDVFERNHRAEFKPYPVVLDASRKLTVCLLSQGYLPEVKGGIPRLTYDLACGPAERGHMVHVLTRSSGDHPTVDFENDVWVHRLVPSSEVPPPPEGVKVPLHIWQYSASMLHELRWIHSVHPVDIVEAPVWDAEGIAVVLDGSFRVVTNLETPLKTWIETNSHLVDGSKGQRQFFDEQIAAESLVLERSDAVRAISQAVVKTVNDSYRVAFRPGQVKVVPLGMEDRAVEARPAPPNAFVDILYTGRFELRKGIDVLLRAVPATCVKYPEARFTLAGEDAPQADGSSFTRRFQAQHSSADWFDRVIFTGEISDEELETRLAQCEIFVAPSRYESFGLVFLEAMMFGKPVVGCRAGGMPEVIDHGVTGLLAEPGDEASLRAALDQLLANKAKREVLGRAGRKKYLARYTRDKLLDRTLALYARVLESPDFSPPAPAAHLEPLAAGGAK
ncbi:MAG: glycosyltransferase [Terriglobia bacterium]